MIKGGLQFSIDADGNVVDKTKLVSSGIPERLLSQIEEKAKQQLREIQKTSIDGATSNASPFSIKEVKVTGVARSIRTPAQQNWLKSVGSVENLFGMEIRMHWDDGVDRDLHLMLPDGSHVFYGNPQGEKFALFLNSGYQCILGASNEFGTYAVWYTSSKKAEGKPIAVVEFKVARPLFLNGESILPGPPLFYGIPDGEDEFNPKKALKFVVDAVSD